MSSNATTREDFRCPFDTYWWWFTKAANNQLGSIKPGANHENNYQPQLVFIPLFTVFYASQVVFPQDFLNYQHISTSPWFSPTAPWVPTLHHHPPAVARRDRSAGRFFGVTPWGLGLADDQRKMLIFPRNLQQDPRDLSLEVLLWVHSPYKKSTASGSPSRYSWLPASPSNLHF